MFLQNGKEYFSKFALSLVLGHVVTEPFSYTTNNQIHQIICYEAKDNYVFHSQLEADRYRYF